MEDESAPRCGFCNKPQPGDAGDAPQLWSPEKRMYITACAPCYARAVAGFRKRLLSRTKGS